MSRLAALVAAASVPLALLAGCSEDEAPAVAGSDDTAGYSAPPPLAGAEGVAADAVLEDCGLEAGPQVVEGEITNSSAAVADFVIGLSWSNDALEDLGAGFAVVEALGAGETARFSLEATVRDGAVFCVPNVQRGMLPD